MNEFLAKHEELFPVLIALGWAIVGWIKAKSGQNTAEKAALAISSAVEDHNSPSLKRAISDRAVQLQASGDEKTANLIQNVAATVDDSKVSPVKDLKEKFEALPTPPPAFAPTPINNP